MSSDGVFIVGKGRAGQAWGKRLESLKYTICYYDPFKDLGAYGEHGFLLELHFFERRLGKPPKAVVIATPPDIHLDYIEILMNNCPHTIIVCEKPLCGLGQYGRAVELGNQLFVKGRPVWVTYNWRWFNPIKDMRGAFREVKLEAIQTRELPAWGLLLDHVSHDIDIVRWLSSNDLEIRTATHHQIERCDQWAILFKDGSNISETVYLKHQVERYAKVTSSGQNIYLNANHQMFFSMWNDIAFGYQYGNYQSALETQRLIEACEMEQLK